jgi:hypothetical protein
MKPALLKVVEQLLLMLQLLPLGQHWLPLPAANEVPVRVTFTAVPLAAAGWLRVVLTMPVASKVNDAAARLPALLLSVAVAPAAPVKALVQGLEASEQAVNVKVLVRHVRLLDGSVNS